jgi:hypothetical protein
MDTKPREKREKELRALLTTPEGLASILALYHQTSSSAARPATLGRIGLLACQMIPLILDAEFPAAIPA